MSSGRGRMASIRASRAAEQPWMSPMAMVRGVIMDAPEPADGPRPADQAFNRPMAKSSAVVNVTRVRSGATSPAASTWYASFDRNHRPSPAINARSCRWYHVPHLGKDRLGHSSGIRHAPCMSNGRDAAPRRTTSHRSFPTDKGACVMGIRHRLAYLGLAFLEDTLADLEGILEEVRSQAGSDRSSASGRRIRRQRRRIRSRMRRIRTPAPAEGGAPQPGYPHASKHRRHCVESRRRNPSGSSGCSFLR